MKAMVIKEFGGVEKFETCELPKPEVKAGEVLVRVAATSVNPVDTMSVTWERRCPSRLKLRPCWGWILPAPSSP